MKQEDPKPNNQWQSPAEEDQPIANDEDTTELTEEDLDQVNGGEITQDVTVNKAKVVDKAHTIFYDWIKS